ncbi:phosphomannomutase CpsG, partial [Enterobacter hormaechei]
HALEIDRTEGITMAFPQWRIYLRSSNTEPVVPLNLQSRADTALIEDRTKDILALLNQ